MKQLHENFRPQRWEGVVGQDKVIKKIRTAARRGLLGRAFWISGPNGAGKTTIARLIAAEVADEFCTEEIDTADDRLIANVLASVAAYVNEVRSERIVPGQAAGGAAVKRWGGSE